MSNVPRPGGGGNPPQTIRRLETTREAVAVVDDTTPAAGNVLNTGRALAVAFDASPQDRSLAHRLGRKPRGWIVTRQFDAPASVIEVSSDDRFLVLRNLGAAAYRAEILVY